MPSADAVAPAPGGGYPGGNTGDGQNAALDLTSGQFNTDIGFFSLRSDTTGQLSTAIGAAALLFNTANQNTAIGAGALLSNTTGNSNNAAGVFALFSNIDGSGSNALGNGALRQNIHAGENTALGDLAPANNDITGSNLSAHRQHRRQPKYGHWWVRAPNNQTGRPQYQLGPCRGQPSRDGGLLICIGANVAGAVNAMLLNEFLKEHRKVEEQQATITQLQQDSAEQRKQIEALTAGLQKVSAQLEKRKPASQMVNNP